MKGTCLTRLRVRPYSRLSGPLRRVNLRCNCIASPFKIKLLHPVRLSDAHSRKLLVYLPGTDGTGQAIVPQLPKLLDAGYDVRTLYIPPEDRSGWDQLQAQVLYLLLLALSTRRAAASGSAAEPKLTLVAESFGGCLGLRLAAAAPQLLDGLVLVNPATCFNQSLGGLSSFVTSTNLLGLFPQNAYATAQAVLLPFLVDMDRVEPAGREALKRMILMEPPRDFDPVQEVIDEDEYLSTRRRPTSPVFSPAAGPLFAPAAAANFRANLLRSGDLSEPLLRGIHTPTLVISSAKDRMLPSITEGARLVRSLPRARRIILPDSGHACLLERGISLTQLMDTAGMLPHQLQQEQQQRQQRWQQQQQQQVKGPPPPSAGAAAAAGTRRPAAGGAAARAGAAAAAAAAGRTVKVRVPASLSSSPRSTADEEQTASTSPLTAAAAGAAQSGAESSSSSSSRPWPQGPQEASAAGKAASAVPSTSAAGSSSSSSAGVSRLKAQEPWEAGSAKVEGPAGGEFSKKMADNLPVASSSSSSGNGSTASSSSSDGSGTVDQVAASTSGSSSSPSTLKRGRAEALVSAAASSSSSSSRNGSNGSNSGSSGDGGEGSKDLAWDQWCQYLAPWRDLVSPVLIGLEQLPDVEGEAAGRAMLFVGNHQKMGMYDMPLLLYELYMRGFKVKGLAHPGHWKGPLGPFFEQFGAVKAGPLTAHRLLKHGEQVLLFPGGAREVNKRQGEEYQLFWRDTPDFVRLAAKHDAIIVPFAAVGADDAYEVMMDVDQLLEAPVLGQLVKNSLAQVVPDLAPNEAILPLTKLPGTPLPAPIPVPNLQRLYFKFCAPIDTRQLRLARGGGSRGKADGQWQALYDDIRETVIGGMEELLQLRDADDERYVDARLSKAFTNWLPALSLAQQQPEGQGPKPL